MLTTTNKRVACAPFEKNEIKSTIRHGLAVMDHLVKLEKTTVVFPYKSSNGEGGVEEDTVVYLPGDSVKQKWASEVFTHNETRFILVPVEQIVAYEGAE